MKAISFGLATVVTATLFGAFGSVAASPRGSVDTHVATMYAVLPDGGLVQLAGAPGNACDASVRSVSATPRASVDTHVGNMYAVLPDGGLVQLASAPSNACGHASAMLKL
jgi:hypothetical protein